MATPDLQLAHPVRQPAWTLTYRGVAIAGKIASMVTAVKYVSHAGGAARSG